MPRDAKRMKPVKAWATVRPRDGFILSCHRHKAAATRELRFREPARLARVLITELPPKRKRHAT